MDVDLYLALMVLVCSVLKYASIPLAWGFVQKWKMTQVIMRATFVNMIDNMICKGLNRFVAFRDHLLDSSDMEDLKGVAVGVALYGSGGKVGDPGGCLRHRSVDISFIVHFHNCLDDIEEKVEEDLAAAVEASRQADIYETPAAIRVKFVTGRIQKFINSHNAAA